MCLTTPTALQLFSAFVRRDAGKKETSGVPTTIYYPTVFATNATLRLAACYFSLWLSWRLVFTNTFFLCAQRTHLS